MTIQELEKIMVQYGVAIRAIPQTVISVYEASHIDQYPEGHLEFLEGYGREMLIVQKTPHKAGKFVIIPDNGTSTSVSFACEPFYDSIEDAVDALLEEMSERQTVEL